MDRYTQKIYTKKGITKEEIFPGEKVLHIGCGNSKLKGAVGIDVLSLSAVDVVHNLDLMPWPFANESFDVIYAHSVVEHISDLVAFFDESWRILKPGGRIVMAVPYFRCVDSFTDPTHKHFFTTRSLDYFLDIPNPLSGYSYSKNKFSRIGFWYGWPDVSSNALVRLFKNFITSHSTFYDQYLSLLFPVKILVWELQKK